jgi:hypothetical protein
VVNEDAADTTINLFNAFDDVEDPDSALDYTIVGNTNPALFGAVTLISPNLILSYAPNASGTSTITIRATDTEGLFSQTSFLVTVLPVNDLPQIDLNGNGPGTEYAAVYNTNGGPVVIASNSLTVSDLDNEMVQSATIAINNPLDNTAEVLSANTTGTTITAVFNPDTGVLTLNGSATIIHYQKVLRTVKYQNTAPEPNTTLRQVSFTVFDGESASNTAIATVQILDPSIAIGVLPAVQKIVKNTTAFFTVAITNTGNVTLEDLEVTAPNAAKCANNLNVSTLSAGQSTNYVCTKPKVSTGFDNMVTVTAVADGLSANNEVSAEDTAVVIVENPDIELLVTPAAGSDTVLAGSNAVLNVRVENTGPSELRNVTVSGLLNPAGSEDFVPFSACDLDIGTLPFQSPPVEYPCTIPNVQQGFTVHLVVTALHVAGNTTIEDSDIAVIHVLALEVEVSSVPFELFAGIPSSVQFNVTVRNNGSKNVTLDSLFSENAAGNPLHGELTDPDNPLVTGNSCATSGPPPVLVANGGQFACEYTVQITAQPPAYTAVIEAAASDNQGNDVIAQGQTLIAVSTGQPVEVILSANPNSVVAPGGSVILTVLVKNNQGTNFLLQNLTDSVLQGLNGVGSCDLPQTIAPNSNYSCAYSVTISGPAGTELSRTVTATGGGRQYSDSVTIAITALPIRRILLPAVTQGYVAGEPNDSYCTAQPVGINIDAFFLPDDHNDWYRFTLTEEANVVVTMSNFVPREGQLLVYKDSGTCQSTPTLLKHDGDRNEIFKIVDLGLQPAGQYLIWVLTDINFSQTQPYRLRVSVTEP